MTHSFASGSPHALARPDRARRTRRAAPALLLLATATALGGCGGEDDAEAGEKLFSGAESALLGAAGNAARCSTCHSSTATSVGNSGDSLKDIAFRTSFKGGDAPTLLAASNACVTGWMGGAALTESGEQWKQLEAYLVSISDAAVTAPNPLAPEVLASEAAYEAKYAGGNAAAGAAKYTAACARCHDGGLKLGPAVSPGKATLKSRTAAQIAQKVRTSGPPPSTSVMGAADTTPGPMPFFEPDELSEQDLKDIIAFVRQ
jgi:mono/diheme cytochrome c family protein